MSTQAHEPSTVATLTLTGMLSISEADVDRIADAVALRVIEHTRHINRVRATQPKPDQPATYDAHEVAAMLGCDVSTIHRMARTSGHINSVPAIRVSPKRVVFAKVLVDRMLGLDDETQDVA